ncbi:MAG: hypothetical protein P4M01_00310 [Acidobacteriota bacterium]|nr:hypothetical protein [Acidobacteriota bacterium]
MRRLICFLFFLISTVSAFCQQDYVGRYALYAGYSHLVTPDMRLYQKGFNLDAGVNVRRWISLGVDYSRFDGSSSLGLKDLAAAQQAKLIPYLNQMPGYTLDVPFDARTYTITAGPQINIRHFKKATLFVRPACGMLHEVVTGKPRAGDTFAYEATANMVGPSLAQADFIRFYGVGGGANWSVSKHFGVRISADYVHSFLFRDVLAHPRNTLRLSLGPSFNFGPNVKK